MSKIVDPAVDKFVFLDFDGVLNSKEDWANPSLDGYHTPVLCKRKSMMVNRLLKETGAHLIISSAWRGMMRWDDLVNHLHKHGIEQKPVAKTLDCNDDVDFTEARHREVVSTAKRFGINHWVALEDMVISHERFININPHVGFTWWDFDRAVGILQGK